MKDGGLISFDINENSFQWCAFNHWNTFTNEYIIQIEERCIAKSTSWFEWRFFCFYCKHNYLYIITFCCPYIPSLDSAVCFRKKSMASSRVQLEIKEETNRNYKNLHCFSFLQNRYHFKWHERKYKETYIFSAVLLNNTSDIILSERKHLKAKYCLSPLV